MKSALLVIWDECPAKLEGAMNPIGSRYRVAVTLFSQRNLYWPKKTPPSILDGMWAIPPVVGPSLKLVCH
jgi:hypothetical protein